MSLAVIVRSLLASPTPLVPARAPLTPGPGADVVWHIVAATHAAALDSAAWAGRGDPMAADAAATDAMRAVLARAPAVLTVRTGEGAKDGAPMLADGEQLGDGPGGAYDIAVDPLECTDLCARGMPGAIAAVAIAPAGAMWSPGPAFYMDKLVLPAGAVGAAQLGDPPDLIVAEVARALGKDVGALRVVVLDKPRHEGLVARLQAAGARVATPTAGDVAGALSVILPGGGADVLLGIGGTPEGVLAASAVGALGGTMQARLAPQRDDELRAIEAAGIDRDCVLEADDLVAGNATFVATGVTGGLLDAPSVVDGYVTTESIVIRPGSVYRIRHTTQE